MQIILGHNQTNGNMQPSESDKVITLKIYKCGNHVINFIIYVTLIIL